MRTLNKSFKHRGVAVATGAGCVRTVRRQTPHAFLWVFTLLQCGTPGFAVQGESKVSPFQWIAQDSTPKQE